MMLRYIRSGIQLLAAGLLLLPGIASAGRMLVLPELSAPQDTTIRVPIRATGEEIISAVLAFRVDTNSIRPAELLITTHCFQNEPTALTAWNMVGDTIIISLAATRPVTLQNGLLAEIALRILPDAEVRTRSPLAWVPYRLTKINEKFTDTRDGEIFILPAGARPPQVQYFNTALIRPAEESVVDPFLFMHARVTDRNGLSTVEGVRFTTPDSTITLPSSPSGEYIAILPAPDFTGGTFTIQATDSDELSSAIISDVVPPPSLRAPVVVFPVDAATGVVSAPVLDWTDVSGAGLYMVHLSGVEAPPSGSSSPDMMTYFLGEDDLLPLLNTATKQSEYRVPAGALQADTPYYWVVAALDKEGDYDEVTLSPFHQFTTRPAPVILDTQPPVLTLVPEITGRGETAISLRWRTDEASDTEVYYSVQGETRVDTVRTIDLATEHRITVKGLSAGTSYILQAASTDLAGNTRVVTLRYAVSTLTAPDITPPTFVSFPQIALVTEDRAIIQWSNDEPTTAVVALTGAGSDTTIRIDVARREHVLDITGLEPGTEYVTTISVADGDGNRATAWIGPEFRTRQLADTRPPTITRRATAIPRHNEATITWGADEPHTARVIVRHPHGSDGFAADAYVDNPAAEHLVRITGLEPATNYEFLVQVVDIAKNAAMTRPYQFKTLAAPDTEPPRILRGPLPAYISNRRIILFWMTDEPADTYVEVRVDNQVVNTFSTGLLTRMHRAIVTQLAPGTAYNFFISSSDAEGNTVTFPSTQTARTGRTAGGRQNRFGTSPNADVVPPTILTPPTVLARTATSFTVGWSTDETANSVVRFNETGSARISRNAGQFDQSVSISDHVTSHSVTITNLSSGTTYAYQVGSTDPSGNGESVSDVNYASTLNQEDLTPPVLTSGPQVINRTDTRLTLSWTTDEPSDTYVAYKASGSAGDSLIMSVPDLVTNHTVTLTNLTAATQYSISVRSSDLLGNTSQEATISGTTLAEADTDPPAITDGPDVRVDATRAWISWTTDEASDSYIEYGLSTSYGNVVSDPDLTLDHELVLANLTAGTLYNYRVVSVDGADNAVETSETLTFTTALVADTEAPAKVAGVAVAEGATEVRVSWSANSEPDLAGYYVERAAGGEYSALSGRIQATEYIDNSVQPGANYSYRVRAVDASANANTGDASNAVSALPATNKAPGTPVSIAATGNVSPRPLLKVLNAQEGIRSTAGYSFIVAADQALTQPVATVSGIEEGSDDTTRWQLPYYLEHNTTYWWAAAAVDEEGFTGSLSASQSFVVDTNITVSVELTRFTATNTHGNILLAWETVPCGEQPVFHIWRSSNSAESQRLTQLGVSGAGTAYTFFDQHVLPGVSYTYTLEATERNGNSSFFTPVTITASGPNQVVLNRNVPNPFNPTTTLFYEIPGASHVRLAIYNVTGQVTRVLADETKSAGYYAIAWDGTTNEGRPAASGVYIVRLTVSPTDDARPETRTMRMLMLK